MSVKLQHIDTLNDQRKLDLQVNEGKETINLFKLGILQGISVQFSSLLKLVKDHQDQYEDNNSLLNKRLAEYSKQGIISVVENEKSRTISVKTIVSHHF